MGLSDQNARNMAIAGIVLGRVSIILVIVIPVVYRAIGMGMGRFDFGMLGRRGLSELGKFRHFK